MYYDTIEDFEPTLSANALEVLSKRYLRGETPGQMFRRVASTIAEAERNYIGTGALYANNVKILDLDEQANPEVKKWSERFYKMMASLDFMPNSPTLLNAGRPQGQLSACFVVPVGDSMEKIFGAIYDMAMIQKTGGGTGFNFSNLRPAGDLVSSTVGEASGPISFMEAFDACTAVVKQGGARRGANMGILRIDHPDIEQFICLKQDLTKLTNFNISVGITNAFMTAVQTDADWDLTFNGKVYKTVKAAHLWDTIVKCAWQTGDPGLIFLDTIEAGNKTPQLGRLDCTNPCGEQPLLPYESCNLGSINLLNFVKPRNQREGQTVHGWIDWSRLDDCVVTAIRFLDNVIDLNKYPIPAIEEATKKTRKIGLGVMGWADLLFELGLAYDGSEAALLAKQIMVNIQDAAERASKELGEIRGSYPACVPAFGPKRNAALTTIAPTGTISIACGVSSGIEPVFALAYQKHLASGGTLDVVHPIFREAVEEAFDEYEAGKILEFAKVHGSIQECELAPDWLKEIFITAQDIHYTEHIRAQSVFQQCIDNAVSKTINMQADATILDVQAAYLFAYQMGCKGVTVFRDGCRNSQPLTKGTVEKPTLVESLKKATKAMDDFGKALDKSKLETYPTPVKLTRPETLQGITTQIKTGCGTMFITANMHEGRLYEVFLKSGAFGGCAAFTEATARLISIALRHGVAAEDIINQLHSVRCDNFRYQVGKNPELKGKSCPDVIGAKMLEFLKSVEKGGPVPVLRVDPDDILADAMTATENEIRVEGGGEALIFECPECGADLMTTEGCITCPSCGFSKC